MAGKQKAGKATEPVDASAIDQESALEKPDEKTVPSREGLATHGYFIPQTFRAMEEAGGDPEKAAHLIREQAGTRTQAEINAEADEATYGKKKGAAPAENKSGKK